MLGFLAKLLVNERVIRHLLSATVTVADDVRRRSREVERSGRTVGDVAARVDSLEASMLKESGMTSRLATQLESTAAALQIITFRLAIALVVGGFALVIAIVALLIALLR